MKKHFLFIFWILGIGGFFQGCGLQPSGIAPPEAPAASTARVTETPFVLPTVPAPKVFIDPVKQNGETVRIAPGEIFAIAVPSGFPAWQITYADTVIQPLTPPEHMQAPGPQGWLFRAVARGQTDVRLMAPAAVCDPGTPCPPAAPITFVFTIEVK